MRRSAAMALALALGLASATAARAVQQLPPAGVEFDDSDIFKPTVDPGAFLTIYDSATISPGHFSLGFWEDYANHGLKGRLVLNGEEQNISIVNHVATTSLVTSVGLASRLELGLHAPLYVTSLAGRQAGFEQFSGTDVNLGDFTLDAKVGLLQRHGGEGFGLAVLPMLGLPTGNRHEFAGTGKLSGGGLLIADYAVESWRIGANFGGVIRDGVGGRGGSDHFEDQLKWGLAVSRGLDPGVRFIGEIYGLTDAGRPFGSEFRSPVEMVGAIRIALGSVDLTGGFGGGLNSGKNDARFRLFLGVTSAAAPATPAGAGAAAIDLTSSRKTYVVEDYDRNGQVSPGDAIVYTITLLNTGYEAAQNVVVIDPIPANTDFVPGSIQWNDQAVEDSVGYAANPPRIELRISSLPATAGSNEMTIKFKAKIRGGLPSVTSVRNQAHVSSQGGGELALPVVETAVFPVAAARERAFETPTQVSPKPKLEITQNIQFETNRAVIRHVSYAVLDDVASILKERPQLEIQIVGHTDNIGGATANRRLSQERAEAVKAYLVKKGVAASRLQAIGKGATEPVATNSTETGRSANRRVEFVIVKGSQ